MLEMSRKLEAGNFQSLVYLWAWSTQVCEDTEYSHIFACLGLSFWHCWDPVKPIITRILTGHEPKPFMLMMAPCSHSSNSGPTANWRCGVSVLNSLGKIFWIQLFYVAVHCTARGWRQLLHRYQRSEQGCTTVCASHAHKVTQLCGSPVPHSCAYQTFCKYNSLCLSI